MSEFSDAVFVHTGHTALALESVKVYPYRYEWRRLTDRWLAIFLEYPDYDLTRAELWMKQVSAQFPVMFFQNASDHGWAYQIFSAGQVIAEVQVSYELSWHMWVDLMEVRHPEMEFPYNEIGQDEVDRMYAEIEASEAFRIRVEEQYRGAAPDTFRLFGFSDEQIQIVRAALDIAWYLDPARRHEQVYAFAKSVELDSFDWMSFRYLSH